MASQTNSILRYVRPQSVWLCPDCDAENELTESSCFLCGCGKTVSAVIVQPVNNFDFKETDVPAIKDTPSKKSKKSSFISGPISSTIAPPRSEPEKTGTISSGGLEALEYTVPPEKKRNPFITILVALLITIGLTLLGVLIFFSLDYKVSTKDDCILEEYYEKAEISEYNNPNFYIDNN